MSTNVGAHGVCPAQAPERILIAYDRYAPADGFGCFVSRCGRVETELYRSGGQILTEVRFVEWYPDPIVLADVEFQAFVGYRVGCLPSGMLGFATGRRVPTEDFLAEAGLSTPLKFDGNRFVIRETRQPITRCQRLLLMPDGRAAALLCEADLRGFVERTYGREASMPLAELGLGARSELDPVVASPR